LFAGVLSLFEELPLHAAKLTASKSTRNNAIAFFNFISPLLFRCFLFHKRFPPVVQAGFSESFPPTGGCGSIMR